MGYYTRNCVIINEASEIFAWSFVYFLNEWIVYIVKEVAEKYAEEFDMAPDIIQLDTKG